MATTLGDYGRTSDKYGEISYFYAFPYRLYFGQHQIAPEDVLTWCQENCTGYYKVTAYTHESSVRDETTGDVTEKVVYIDKIYLSDANDVLKIKLTYDVRDTKVQRPRLKRKYTKRKSKVSQDILADVADETTQDTVALVGVAVA